MLFPCQKTSEQFAAALARIRERIEREPVERAELQRVCGDLGVPSDFDICQTTWRPDYEPFFYRQLCRRARRIYFFRNEYIFDLEMAIISEVPKEGHATYVFARPDRLDEFLCLYARSTKADIRENRDNIAERLRFLCRIVHGRKPAEWLRELRRRIGEHKRGAE